MSEPLIRIQPVLDPDAKGITVEKMGKLYVVSAPRQLTPMEALAEVARVDPDGLRRRGE